MTSCSSRSDRRSGSDAQPSEGCRPFDREPVAEPVAELTDVVFVTKGINGLPRTTLAIPVANLAGIPLEQFMFGDVKLTPAQLQDVITKMVAGQTKTAVLKSWPGFSASKYGAYSDAYRAVSERIKPASWLAQQRA